MNGCSIKTLAACGLLGLGVCGGILASRKRKLDHAGIHVSTRTKGGPALVFDLLDQDGSTMRMLVVEGVVQSVTYTDERRYELAMPYLAGFDAMFEPGRPVRDVLMLGGGGYGYPKHLVAERPECRVDVVEADPAITRLARRYFYVNDLMRDFSCASTGRLRAYTAEGRAFLENPRVGRPLYDAIVCDCFQGKVPAASLATVEAAQAVKARLAPGGTYLTNVVAALEGPASQLLWSQTSTLSQVFSHVHAIPVDPESADERDNVIVIASDCNDTFPGELPTDALPTGPILADESVASFLPSLVM